MHGMRSGVIAQKVGMTRIFTDAGEHIPVTVLKLDKCQVLGHRTNDKNGYTAMQSRKIRYHRLADLVDFVLISEEAGVHKPDKAIFDLALGKARVTAKQSLFVGDTPSTDIEGARNAGLHAALIDPRDTWTDFESDGVPKIRRLGELPALLGLN